VTGCCFQPETTRDEHLRLSDRDGPDKRLDVVQVDLQQLRPDALRRQLAVRDPSPERRRMHVRVLSSLGDAHQPAVSWFGGHVAFLSIGFTSLARGHT
jgi:hypothetical protein